IVEQVVDAAGEFQILHNLPAEERQVCHVITFDGSTNDCFGTAAILNFKAGEELFGIKGDNQVQLGKVAGAVAQLLTRGDIVSALHSVAHSSAEPARMLSLQSEFPTISPGPVQVVVDGESIGVGGLVDQPIDAVVKSRRGELQMRTESLLINGLIGGDRFWL